MVCWRAPCAGNRHLSVWCVCNLSSGAKVRVAGVLLWEALKCQKPPRRPYCLAVIASRHNVCGLYLWKLEARIGAVPCCRLIDIAGGWFVRLGRFRSWVVESDRYKPAQFCFLKWRHCSCRVSECPSVANKALPNTLRRLRVCSRTRLLGVVGMRRRNGGTDVDMQCLASTLLNL